MRPPAQQGPTATAITASSRLPRGKLLRTKKPLPRKEKAPWDLGFISRGQGGSCPEVNGLPLRFFQSGKSEDNYLQPRAQREDLQVMRVRNDDVEGCGGRRLAVPCKD